MINTAPPTESCNGGHGLKTATTITQIDIQVAQTSKIANVKMLNMLRMKMPSNTDNGFDIGKMRLEM